MKRLYSLFLCFCAAWAALLATRIPAEEGEVAVRKPRLVVLISIDQFRADYVTRFADLYLPPRSGEKLGGFRYLQSFGAWYPDCRYQHHRTVTAAGHSILGTGAQPNVSGIVGNSWWDQAAGKSVYCVSDPKSRVVGTFGSKEKPYSPANQLVTTVGDELEMATGGRARTVSISLKDRAAILMCGHRADCPIWFDEDTGNWISSTYYCPDGKLPAWVGEVNSRKIPDHLRQTSWKPGVEAPALERVSTQGGGSREFTHALTGADYGPFTLSPAGNEFVLETARQAVLSESLGQDEIPDILTINLASNDYVGHKYGPDSAEVLDISVQTDRQLASFFDFLAKTVPGGMESVTIALSADHGVVGVPELNAASGVPAGRVGRAIQDAAEKALNEAVGPAKWIASTENGEIYFSKEALEKYPKEPRAHLEDVVIEAIRPIPGVYLSVGKSAVLEGRVPQTSVGRRIAMGVHPARSGDVIVILDPQWLTGSTPPGPPALAGTSHGTPFDYDTHVPLLMAGFGIRRGVYLAPVAPAQIAPTFSHLLWIARPSAADEPLLPGLEGSRRD